VPFLDKEISRVASKMPVNFHTSKKGTKLAFRQAAARHLPKHTAQKKKLGFPVPIRIWLTQEKYYNIVKKYFTNSTAEKYFNIYELLKMLDAHKNKKADNSRKIWTVFSFLLWHEQFFS
jgi:asparagine synthase (glutamine-hydrolysing)